MINAKTEFSEHIQNLVVKCATISCWVNGNRYEVNLKINHSKEEYEEFVNQLDFYYHDGFGCQNLFGTIWYDDGTWSERSEYDGSEWWEHMQAPIIPDDLKG